MSSDELGTLHDVFHTQKATYMLQYLWRCTVSDYDIIGPYFSSAGGLSAKFILVTLFETMHVSSCMVSKQKPLCVMEQAQTCHQSRYWQGLDMEHMETRRQGVQTTSTMWRHGFWTHSPMRRSLHWYVHHTRWVLLFFSGWSLCWNWYGSVFKCHALHFVLRTQLKNMVAALYSSKTGKTVISVWGVKFGWETIEGMFEREVQRAKAGVPHWVPGLRESYMYREILTRPNVKPAKIMQVSYVRTL